MQSLHNLFMDRLRDLYDAEHQIVQALPKMAQAAHSQELKQAFQTHLRETENQISRLEQVFQMMGQAAQRKHCKGMEGLIKEGEETMKTYADDDVRDAGLIDAAQKVEHYEIAGYGTLRTFAQMLGYPDAANMLQQTLDEEGMTDKKLTAIAETKINVRAMEPDHRM